MNYRIIFRALGFLLFVEGIAMLLALIVSLAYGEYDTIAFLISAGICTLVGGGTVYLTRKAQPDISRHEGYIIVTLVWVVFSFFGSLPYILSGAIPDFTNAFFETISGFSTTGATILEDIESLPHGILFWRSISQWLGGMGIIVLSIAILPVFGIGGMQLYMAEVPGPTPDRISPRIRQSAKTLWGIYLVFTLVEAILLWIAGMNVFDAVCHSFTTMSSGGFSTKQASIAHWDSALIQYIVIFFMIFAGTNFAIIYLMIKGRFKKVVRDEEYKSYLLFIVVFTLIICGSLLFTSQINPETAFRDSLFQVVSIITTTGFGTIDYMGWPPVLYLLLFTLFFFGGSAGSTGGGMKIMRIVLLLKNSYYELKRMVHPHAVIPVVFNKKTLDSKIINNVLAFFILYFVIFGLGTIVYSFIEPDVESAMGAVASSIGNVGPGIGNVGPSETYLHVHPFGKWFLSFLMLLGRLEFFTVLVLFSPSFWRE